MTDAKKPRPAGLSEEIDLRLGGLLGQLGSALTEALSRLEDQGEVHHETTFDSARGPVRASAGIRIRTVKDAKAPKAARRPDQPVNTPHPGTASPNTAPPDTASQNSAPADTAPADLGQTAPRAISATILSDGATWRLIAELPGVDRSGVTLGQDGQDLTISATGRGRHYDGRFALPAGATAAELSVTLQNGILELFWAAPR